MVPGQSVGPRGGEPAARSVLEPDNVALIRAIAAGDRQALGTLYDGHAPLLLGLAKRMLGSAAAAEDLLHDVFIEVWQHAAEYAPERGSVRTWLLVRTRSRALDRLGRSARDARLADEAGDEAIPTAAPTAPAAIDGARVRRMLHALPQELVAVLDLAYFEGLSSTEIAARLGIPVGTVKSRVARALGALREALSAAREREAET
jgi:RNA polymerase sigma-70 factor (ECF subfamily)